MDDVAISIKNVSKSFKLPHERHNSVKSLFVNLLKRRRTFEQQHVLKDISLDIKKGEFFGIIGRNGCGKSTLLKMLAGIYSPDKGHIQVNGKLTPFIELGVGFNPELTGRENVFLNGALLGFNRREVEAMYDKIVAFAELERFMDQKLKNYSSGMQVRLAFAIAINARSEILLLDEVLAVGDAAFMKKCYDYFRQLKKDKRTVVFISHDMNAIREYCDKVVLIEKGEILHKGQADSITQKYIKLFVNKADEAQSTNKDQRWGNGKVVAEKISVDQSDQTVKINVRYKVKEAVSNPIFGLSIISPVGLKVFESNTKWQRKRTGNFEQGTKLDVSWDMPNIFTNGTNYITPAAADEAGLEFYDWWDEAASFIVDKDSVTTAVTLPKHQVKIEKC